MNGSARYSLIMLIDDNELDIMVNKKLIETENFSSRAVSYTSAQEALDYLKNNTTSPDSLPVIIFLDIMMPGMDGFQLLKEAKARYPQMVRIAFSGQQGQSLGLRSTDLAHQFLEKPIDAQLLRSIMTRACGLRALLSDDNVRKIVTNLKSLPSLPVLYKELMDEIHSGDASLKKIARIISKDMAMEM